MDYQKQLNKHHIDEKQLQAIATQLAQRAKDQGLARQADAIYQAAALDLAMGAVELYNDTQEGMKESISPIQWLEIITDCKLA